MKESNLYWPFYKNIETEVIKLTSSIHFCDNQLSTYSMSIADLIFRCASELESIAKDLYRDEVRDEPPKTGTCFKWLEESFHIDKKEISVASPYMFFHRKYAPSFSPFNYVHGSNEDYYSSYNAIKHDRLKNLDKASINTLIRILGALYILNLYYRDAAPLDIGKASGYEIDETFGSSIFLAKCINNTLNYPMTEVCSHSYIYELRFTEESVRRIDEAREDDEKSFSDRLFSSKQFQEYISAGQDPKLNNVQDLAIRVGGWNFLREAPKTSFEDKKSWLINTQQYKTYIKNNPNGLLLDESLIDEAIETIGGIQFMSSLLSGCSSFLEAFKNGRAELSLVR